METKQNFIIKSITESNMIISGYASVYNVIDYSEDIILRGAFKSASAENIKFLWQHNQEKPIGIIKSLFEDDYGLNIEGIINCDVAMGKEAASLVKQGALNGLSVGFCIKSHTYNDLGQRIISECNLLEISIVTFPANEEAKIYKINKSTRNQIDNLNLALKNLYNSVTKIKEKNLWN